MRNVTAELVAAGDFGAEGAGLTGAGRPESMSSDPRLRGGAESGAAVRVERFGWPSRVSPGEPIRSHV
jgi:hypothetical protein